MGTAVAVMGDIVTTDWRGCVRADSRSSHLTHTHLIFLLLLSELYFASYLLVATASSEQPTAIVLGDNMEMVTRLCEPRPVSKAECPPREGKHFYRVFSIVKYSYLSRDTFKTFVEMHVTSRKLTF